MSETNTTDNNTYHEVNIDRYSQLQDNDDAGIFDLKSSLFTNGNGDAKLTSGGANENNFEVFANWYDFDKKEFTNAGRNFYTKQMESSSDDEKNAYLTQVENELKMALIDDYNKRKKSNPNAKPNSLLGLGGNEPPPPTEVGIDLDKVQANFKKIQPTDTLLQRLSLRNLKYPIDADYGNTQDYIQINQFTYQGVNPSVLFPKKGFRDEETGKFIIGSDKKGYKGRGVKETTFDAAKRIAGTTLAGEKDKEGNVITPAGLQRTSPKNHHIGLVKLPMPNQLNDSNNVAWGEDQLNALTAAAATLGAGALDQGIQFTENLLNGKYEGPFDFMKQVFGSAQKDGLALVDFLKQASKDQDANLLARSAVGSSLLNLAGFGISPETILARGAGVIPNSNLELLFNAPALRAFRFDWKMSPRSQQEAIRINNIIRFFKQGMAAKKVSNSTPGGSSYFLGTPNIFDIHFKTSKSKNEFTNTNHSVLKIKTCACVGAAVNYTPEGMWNAYEKGQPTSCILSLQFKELEPIYNTDYEEDPFAYTDLTGSLPLDAVGY